MTAVVTPKQSPAIDRTAAPARPGRRTDLDVLRVGLCASVVLAHALLIFAATPYHINSAVPLQWATILFEFTRVTILPFFFVLAGWSAVASLRGREPGYFVLERITRLLLPLIGGIIVFGSAIKYIELSNGRNIGYHGFQLVQPLQISFFEFFPRFMSRLNLVTWSHLWFLAYLFVISLLLLPLLVPLARRVPRTGVPGMLMVYLPAVLLAVQLVVFGGYWPFLPGLYKDGANVAYFALCFALGAGLAAWPGFEARLQSEAPRLLVLMLLAFVGVVWFGESDAGRAFVGLTAWGAIGAGLGFAARLKPAPTPTLSYLAEATMPLYIMHHLPLLLIGVAVLPLALPALVKIALISILTAAVSLGAYRWLVRPWRPVRWLMGMGGARRAGLVGQPA